MILINYFKNIRLLEYIAHLCLMQKEDQNDKKMLMLLFIKLVPIYFENLLKM